MPTEPDRYASQKRYFARLKAKADLFDHLNDLRVGRIRQQITDIRRRGLADWRLIALFPYYLSFPQCQTVIIPRLATDVLTTRRNYTHEPDPKVPTWVAYGDDWDIGVAAYAFSQQIPEEPFRFVGMLRGREIVRQGLGNSDTDWDFYFDPESPQHEQLLRTAGRWVTE